MKGRLSIAIGVGFLVLIGCAGNGTEMGGRSKSGLASLIKSAFSAHAENAGLGDQNDLVRAAFQSPDGEEQNKFFDEWMGLWASSSWSEGRSDLSYFLDEALTEAAGHSSSTWSFTESEMRGTGETEITAGHSAGFRQSNEFVVNMLDFSGFYTSFSDHPQYGRSESAGTWNMDGSGSYSSSWRKGDVFSEQRGQWQPDGTWQTSSTSNEGFTTSMNGNADGSGTGRLTGPDPLLPATIVWNVIGVGTITWADGSTSPFSWGGIGGDGGSDDGSGSTTGGSSGGSTGGTTGSSTTGTTGDSTTGSTTGGSTGGGTTG